MLVKFESPSSGPFITTQSVAEQLVKAMGKSDSLEGIIVSKEVKKTIQKLELKVRLEKNELEYSEKSKVKFSQRAFPLIKMLKRAELKNEFIFWREI
ncbi:MAG: hypothetical protein CBC01_01260 [Betaproteobacteria bacterium TMED41]|nr:MAG: hypothetical protein CBC01_01260 [Betaproteobacteria bacterium TMED41]|tara:strand:+ start:103 stop:393 length:291 start_codon:yes stop_codon:yes gene_type:complete